MEDKLEKHSNSIKMLDKHLDKIDLQKQTKATVDEIDYIINEIIKVTEDERYAELKPRALELQRKFENLFPAAGDPLPPEGGRRKTRRFKKRRLMSKKYCKKTPCRRMGFTQKASCRPYKNCY